MTGCKRTNKTTLKQSNLRVDDNQKTAQVKNHRAVNYDELHVYQYHTNLFIPIE